MDERKKLLKEIRKKFKLLDSKNETEAAAAADELVFLLRNYQLYLDPCGKDKWYGLELLTRSQALFERVLPEDCLMLRQIMEARVTGERLKAEGRVK